jgi:hypothetical protein
VGRAVKVRVRFVACRNLLVHGRAWVVLVTVIYTYVCLIVRFHNTHCSLDLIRTLSQVRIQIGGKYCCNVHRLPEDVAERGRCEVKNHPLSNVMCTAGECLMVRRDERKFRILWQLPRGMEFVEGCACPLSGCSDGHVRFCSGNRSCLGYVMCQSSVQVLTV